MFFWFGLGIFVMWVLNTQLVQFTSFTVRASESTWMIQKRNLLQDVVAKTFNFVFHLLPPLDTTQQMYIKSFLLTVVGALTPCTSREGLLKALTL